MSWFVRLLTDGIIQQFTGLLLEAHRLRSVAQNDPERLAAKKQIARIEAARDIALAEQSNRWSATRIGRLLNVVPFGVWWTTVFAVSILNPLFGWTLTIDDVPSPFWDIATILIPAVILGDVGVLVVRRRARRHSCQSERTTMLRRWLRKLKTPLLKFTLEKAKSQMLIRLKDYSTLFGKGQPKHGRTHERRL